MPVCPTMATVGRFDREGNILEHRFAGGIGKSYMAEFDLAAHGLRASEGILVEIIFAVDQFQDTAGAGQTGRDLRVCPDGGPGGEIQQEQQAEVGNHVPGVQDTHPEQ